MATQKSLASDKTYLMAQLRRKAGRAHFQVLHATEVNRSYGLAFGVPLSDGNNEDAMATIEKLNIQPVASLAKTNRVYYPVQVVSYGDGVLHVQSRGPAVNRPYGVAVDFTNVPDSVLATIESLK